MEKLDILNIYDIKDELTRYESARQKIYLSADIGLAIGINEVFKKLVMRPDPFIVDEARFIMVTQGSISLNVNLIDYELRPGMIGYVGRGSVVQMSPNTEIGYYDGLGMIVRDETLRMALHDKLPESFNGAELHFFVNADADEQTTIRHLIKTMWATVHLPDPHTSMLHSLLAAFVYFVDDIRQKNSKQIGNNHSRDRMLFDRFISLVNKHSAQERRLAFYADHLCISEKYLSTIIRQASGTTAKDWIDRALVTSAKVMLRHTDMQVSAISDALNFPTTSFFCKYFKRLTGITPLQYRDNS